MGTPMDNNATMNGEKPFVFLGGSCNPTTWRIEDARPRLQQTQTGYFNPQVDEWFPELMEVEFKAKQLAAVNLFVIDSETRALMSMMEAVELITTGRNVALAVLNVNPGQRIGEDSLGLAETKDLNRARGYLCDVAKRFGIEVHSSVTEAVEDAIA